MLCVIIAILKYIVFFTYFRSERKDEIIKENVRKQQEEKTFKQWKRQEEMRERAEQAKKAYDEWMNKKQRNDSNTNICAPKPPWCPARSLHFVSPDRLTRVQAARTESTQRLQEKACGYTNDGKESTNSQGTEDEYMLDSFSDASSSSMASEDTAADVQSSPNNSLARDSTGTLKTVQVCCKTLKYWCKCDV